MKRFVSTLLAVLFVMTAFGVTTVFGGVISAGAEFYDYYQYVSFPGYNAFTPEDFSLAWKNTDVTMVGLSDDYMPAESIIDKVAVFSINKTDKYGQASFGTMRQRNADPENNTQNTDFNNSPNWTANDKLNGKDIFGDSGVTFEDANGFCFWVGVNGGAYSGQVKIALFSVPTKGPYYKQSEDGSTDMADYAKGFVFSSELHKGDEDGYFYFDFKTDFKRSDWWSTDDEGKLLPNDVNVPIPMKTLPLVNALEVRYTGLQEGDQLYVGDFRTYTDTRVHIDELDEQCAVFESINPEAYTEESYSEALNIYLEAYAMMQDTTGYIQKQIDAKARELKNAIRDLKPMFMARMNEVKLAGFEVWDDDDFDEMTGGGVCLDTPAIEEEGVNTPVNMNGVLVFANAVDGEPTYGWSLFTNATEDGAVKNPFELLEGSAPLSEASGIRFWIKWDESIADVPNACRIGLGVSEDELVFECEDTDIVLPEKQDYIGAAWTSFYDVDGDEDIFDHIDDIDTIYIYLEGAVGIYYIADLGGFEWNVSSADFRPLQQTVAEARAYMASLREEDWYYKSWDRVFMAIDAAEALIGEYGVTDEDVSEASEAVMRAVNRLIPIGLVADRKTMNELEGLVESAKTYWRGNVTAASYRELKVVLEEAETLLAEDASQEAAEAAIAELRAAITNLVPIKAGEKVTSIHSFENYTTRELNRATGDRTANVTYELNKTFAKLPAGYGQALKMTAQLDMSAQNTDEHGVMQFKSMYRDLNDHPVPIMMGTADNPKANTLIGDLSGTDGICLWVGVNDMNLVQDCTMRFAVSNCEVGPLFERATVDIPIPATGAGWLFMPWEYFEFYDEWTHGQDIDLAKIYFYIVRFNGTVRQGLEVYVTGIHAYKDSTAGVWDTPVISNVTEGQEYDVSEQDLIPEWDVGAAMLDGKFLVYGDPVPTNGEHTLVVTNGDKSATVNFTTTGKIVDATPVVTGVENGGVYEEGVVITWDVGEATINGVPFENGQALYGSGAYTLIVTNGNADPVVINFSVSATAEDEQPVVSGVANGEEYSAPVAATWTPAEATATLNGEPYAAGTEISAAGEYTLVVTNGEKSLTLNFTVREQAPAGKRGDMDGDNEITVADALRALRIAAKLVQPTDNDVATGDIDRDGEITVADALKILRVAAKLAGEDSLA